MLMHPEYDELPGLFIICPMLSEILEIESEWKESKVKWVIHQVWAQDWSKHSNSAL